MQGGIRRADGCSGMLGIYKPTKQDLAGRRSMAVVPFCFLHEQQRNLMLVKHETSKWKAFLQSRPNRVSSAGQSAKRPVINAITKIQSVGQ